MAESKVTIGVDLDTSAVVGKTTQMKEKLGHTFDKVGKDMGGHFEKAIGKLARGVVIAKAIGDAIKAGADEYRKIKEEQKGVAESETGRRLGILKDAQRLGLGVSALATVQSASGSTTEQERAGFLSSLSANDEKSANRKALGMFSSGLFSADELKTAIKSDSLVTLDAERKSRESFLGPDYVKQRDFQDGIRDQNAEKFLVTRDTPLGASKVQRRAELTRLENPVLGGISEGVHSALGKVPLLGDFGQMIMNTTQGGLEHAASVNDDGLVNVRVVNNKKMNFTGVKDE